MARKFFIPLVSSLALGAGILFASAPAAAASYCPSNQSFFGTIERVNGQMLTVRTPSNHWADVQIDSGARITSDGSSLRPGLSVGAYGCVTPDGVFHATALSLTTNQRYYNEQLSGVVRQIQSNGRLLVAQTGRGEAIWYVPDVDEYHVGQRMSATGMVGSNGVFYPQRINGNSTAYDTDYSNAPITRTGTVQRVNANSIVVWEPSNRTSGTWIVNDAGRFRNGERVSATGTEDRTGRFYVQTIDVLGYSSGWSRPGVAAITRTGTVQRVGANAIIVWEPANRTSGTWIVPNAGRFRVGERVSATGTQDRSGRFYVRTISIL